MARLLKYCMYFSNSCSRCSCISWAHRVLMFSSTSPTSSKETTLYSRLLSASNRGLGASIIPEIDKWVQEGRDIEKKDVRMIIKIFRKRRSFNHALQISEWMNDNKYFDMSPGDVAIQLHLVSKIHGLEQAEEYFNKVPCAFKLFQVFGALLNCYTEAKSFEKAEGIMQKMRELGYANTLNYNVMLQLYARMERRDKLESLVQEMEEKDIPYDKFTYNIRLNVYATAFETDKMENLLMKMEADPKVTMDYNAYAVVANGFLKAGARDKALEMMKKFEQLIKAEQGGLPYQILLTMYTTMGKKDELYRIWNLHKNVGRCQNMTYVCMISSLMKLDDLDGAEKILEEWGEESRNFDVQIPHILISAYCNKGLLERAEVIVNRFMESGMEFDSNTWKCMALGYSRNNQMEKAVEATRKSILASLPGWKIDIRTLASCLRYLQEKGDTEVAEELVKLVEKQGHFSTNVTNKLSKFIRTRLPGSENLDCVER